MNKIFTSASPCTCLILGFLTIWELSILDQAICEAQLRPYFLTLVKSHAIQYKVPIHINKMRYPKIFVRWVRRIGIQITTLFVEEFNYLYFDPQEMTEEQFQNKIDYLRGDGFDIDQATVENFDYNDFYNSPYCAIEREIVDVLTVLNDCGFLKLEALSLRNSPLKTSSVLNLSNIFKHLQKLCLSGCDFQLLEHIVEFPSFGLLLRFLDLRNIFAHNECFDSVVTKIAERCTELQYLFLDGAFISDKALLALSKGRCQLVELSLRKCVGEVTCRGLEELMKGCPTLRKLDIEGVIKTVDYDESIFMRTLAGSHIEHLMIHSDDAQKYVLFLAWEVLQSHPTCPQEYRLGTFGSFWRDVAYQWNRSIDDKLNFIRENIEGKPLEQFNFYMEQFKQLVDGVGEFDMRMNFSEYINNPHESVMNFLKMESRDEV